jgi:hypothetical protein
MNPRKPILATLCLACAIPLAGFAADPPKRGDGRPDGVRGDGRPGNNGPNRGGPGGGGDWREREKELSKEFEKFCEAHAPKRWAELKDPTNNNKPRMMGMLWKFRALKSLEKTDKELYEVQVKQIESEDAEYGLLIELKKAEKATATTEKLDELKGKLRAQAATSVDLRLKEKGLRIERLAKLLDAERKATEADKQNQPKLIETRFAQMLEDGPDFFNPKPPTRRDNNEGGGGGANGTPTPPPGNGAQAFPDIR